MNKVMKKTHDNNKILSISDYRMGFINSYKKKIKMNIGLVNPNYENGKQTSLPLFFVNSNISENLSSEQTTLLIIYIYAKFNDFIMGYGASFNRNFGEKLKNYNVYSIEFFFADDNLKIIKKNGFGLFASNEEILNVLKEFNLAFKNFFLEKTNQQKIKIYEKDRKKINSFLSETYKTYQYSNVIFENFVNFYFS
jgi:hypothetical protein